MKMSVGKILITVSIRTKVMYGAYKKRFIFICLSICLFVSRNFRNGYIPRLM